MTEEIKCKKCGSNKVEIEGIAYGVKESEYLCLDCGHSWTDNSKAEKDTPFELPLLRVIPLTQG